MPQVWVQMYHNAPPTRPVSEVGAGQVWCYHVWDHSMVTQTLEALKVTWEPNQLLDALLGIMGPFDDEHPQPTFVDCEMDVYRITGEDAQLRAFAEAWSQEAISECDGVSGDDSYYDYFPDYLHGLSQLCVQIGYRDPINKAVTYAKETRYEDDEEGTLDGIGVDDEPGDGKSYIYGAIE